MNYYKRHLGDFARDCPNLSQGAVGAYTLLLDFYYANENPLPLDRDELVRIARAFTPVDRKNLDAALRLFERTEDGYRSKRADEEIAAYQAKAETNRENGRKSQHGGRPRKVDSETPQKPQSGFSGGATETLSQNPESISQEAKASKTSSYLPTAVGSDPADPIPPCPHAEIIALYHSMLPANPRIKVWDDARQRSLRTRWREDAKRQCLDYWQRFFAHVASSEFLTGQRDDRNGRPFLPGLDWLVKAANFAKVIEGRYHDRSNA